MASSSSTDAGSQTGNNSQSMATPLLGNLASIPDDVRFVKAIRSMRGALVVVPRHEVLSCLRPHSPPAGEYLCYSSEYCRTVFCSPPWPVHRRPVHSRRRGDVIWFEGALLIVGDDSAPIENSAFLVEGSTFSWIGRQGEMKPPDGAIRVDLTGRTVIPALIDAHQHIGLTNVKDGTNSKDNYVRETLVEHLEWSAYHGVADTMSLGLEFDEELAFQLRDEVIANAALFLTSGRGIAATPMAGPTSDYRLGIPRGAMTEAEGRAAVLALHANDVDLVKVWIYGRGGRVPKVEPNVLRAIVDEAHANGMRVVAHVGTTSALADAKDILQAGVDGFAHTVRDRDVDDEYIALVRQHPEVWSIPNLPGNPLTMEDLPWLSETLPPFEIERMREQIERTVSASVSEPEEESRCGYDPRDGD